jgi:hypothetical protein
MHFLMARIFTTSKVLAAFSTTGALGLTSAASPGAGWKYDSVSGQFIADDGTNDSNGTKYYLH